MKLFNEQGQARDIAAAPLAPPGGEGTVYRFEGGDPQLRRKVAKIYNDNAYAATRLKKIAYMVAHPPVAPDDPVAEHIIWPEELLYDETGMFRGFVMPIVKGSIDLEELCTPALIANSKFQRFDHREGGALLRRMSVAMNLAAAIHALHKSATYVLVDLKGPNVRVNPKGMLSLIDMDSIQICQNNVLLHPAMVLTEEYAPPEYHQGRVQPAQHVIDEAWDRFSYAVLSYRLLFGLHPFAGTYLDTSLTTIAEGVREGYFANGVNRSKFKGVPKPHDGFALLPDVIQDLYKQAFDEGHTRSQRRPTMANWYSTLSDAIAQHGKSMKQATVGPLLPTQHPVAHAPVPPPVPQGPVIAPMPAAPPPIAATTTDIWLTLPDGQRQVIGQNVTLTWRILGAASIHGNFKGSIRHGWRLPAYGTEAITVFSTTTFTLRVRYKDGRKVSYSITIPVYAHRLQPTAALLPTRNINPNHPLEYWTGLSCYEMLKKGRSLRMPQKLDTTAALNHYGRMDAYQPLILAAKLKGPAGLHAEAETLDQGEGEAP